MAGLKPPKPLDFSNARERWGEWKARFTRYRSATELDQKDPQRQVDTLLLCMGEESDTIFRQLTIPDPYDAYTIYDLTLTAFDGYFNPHSTALHNKVMFFGRLQSKDESNQAYIRDCYELASKCEWTGIVKNDMLRVRLISGMQDKELSAQMQLDDNPLEEVVAKMRTKEAIQQEMKAQLDGAQQTSVTVDSVDQQESRGSTAVDAVSRRRYAADSKPKPKRDSNEEWVRDCKYCGDSHAKRRCKAYNKRCSLCNKFNHFAKVCSSNKRTDTVQVQDRRSDDSDSDGYFYVTSVEHKSESFSKGKTKWIETLLINGKPIECKVDTGAEVNVIPIQSLRGLGIERAEKTSASLMGYSGDAIPTVGKLALDVGIPGQQAVQSRFYVRGVVRGAAESLPLLSFETACELGLQLPKPKSVDCIQPAKANPTIPIISDIGQVKAEYPKAFDGLGCVKDVTMSLTLKPNAVPKTFRTRDVPIAIQAAYKQEIEEMQRQNVIVPDPEPSAWLNPTVTICKPGKVRICLNPQYLNSQLLRTQCTIPTATSIFSELKGAKYFSCLDVKSGFHQVRLDEASSKLTSFLTPFGKFKYARLPMGLNCSPELFHQMMAKFFEHIPHVKVYIDDILVYGRNEAEHDESLRQVLAVCEQVGLTLKYEKCVIKQTKVTFLGHELSETGLKADHDKVQALRDFAVPKDQEETQRFIGFVSYLSKFIPGLSELAKPLREICKVGTIFSFEQPHLDAFEAIRKKAMQDITLQFYDPEKPVELSVDASAHSLGAVLLQEGKPIEFASKSLTETQQGYSQIEKEMLAVLFGCTRFHYYLFGRQVTIETDHKPLVGLVVKDLNMLTARLATMRLRLLSYDFDLVWKPGKYMILADTLSRACPAGTGENEDLKFDPLQRICSIVLTTDSAMDRYEKATAIDEELQVVYRMIQNGWPADRKMCPERALVYWHLRDYLSCRQGVVFYKDRLVIPGSERAAVLNELHKAHQGITKTLQRAQKTIFWPGIRRHITDRCLSCEPCRAVSKDERKEPLLNFPIPKHPFQVIGTDLFEIAGKSFLLIVDYLSKWPVVIPMRHTTSNDLVKAMKATFAQYGIPEYIVSDNGPQYSSKEFADFCKQTKAKHETCSPHHQQGNGQAERMVGLVKSSMKKSIESHGEWWEALLAIRNTPIGEGLLSPAQILQGRNLRDHISLPLYNLQVQGYDFGKLVEQLKQRQAVQKYYYDRRAGPDKSNLVPGNTVMFKTPHKWKSGVVSGVVGDRSYSVETPQGLTLRRNRKDVRVIGPAPVHDCGAHQEGEGTTPPEETRPPDSREMTSPTADQNQGVLCTPRRPRSGRQVGPPVRWKDYVMTGWK